MATPKSLNRIARIVGLVLLVAAVAAVFFLKTPPPEPPEPPIRPVRAVTLESPQTTSERSFPGRVQASSRVDLSFRVTGPLIDLSVHPGDRVEEGQILGQIDPRDFKVALDAAESSLAEARAQLTAMQIGVRPEELRMLEEAVSSAESMFRTSKEQFERYEGLILSGAISQREYDVSRASFEVNQSKLRSAQEDLERGKSGERKEDIEAQEAVIRGLEAKVDSARNQLADCTLRAPFVGTIARRFVENFQFVRAEQPIFSLQDAENLEIVIRLPEGLVAEIRREQVDRIAASFEAAPGEEFALEIVETETEAEARTQTYAITLKLDKPEGIRVLPGMTADVHVYLTGGAGQTSERWPLPADAIFADEVGAQFVWKVDPATQTVSRAQVQTGDVAGDSIYVEGGVSTGEIIVTAGVHSLREGLKVRLLSESN